MKSKKEIAMDYFKEGYNCSQAVFLAYAGDYDISEEDAKLMSAGFGGGMGRLREVCGTVSGMTMVAGLESGSLDPKDTAAKQANYEMVQKLANRFKEINGSIICHELLGLGTKNPTVSKEAMEGAKPEARTEQYYKKRPCVQLVGIACDILDEELQQRHQS